MSFVVRVFDLLRGSQITINRPERRNAFRPETVKELQRAFAAARDDPAVGVIIFTGKVRALPAQQAPRSAPPWPLRTHTFATSLNACRTFYRLHQCEHSIGYCQHPTVAWASPAGLSSDMRCMTQM